MSASSYRFANRGTSQDQLVTVVRSTPITVDYRRGFSDLRRRTPGPPPFSSMNSTPAASRVRRTARLLAEVIEVSPSANSARRIVATLNELSRARSSALHLISERAARIWPLVNEVIFSLTLFIAYAIFNIIRFYSYRASQAAIGLLILQRRGRHEIERVERRATAQFYRRFGRPDHPGQG